jgi:mRNA-degrading endonuclease RelE of RelBE toxin-antitoxin system
MATLLIFLISIEAHLKDTTNFYKKLELLQLTEIILQTLEENYLENICQKLVINPIQLAIPMPAYHRKLWKTRIPSTDMKRGKSGGFRMIFYYNEDAPNKIYRLAVYVKAEREDLSPREMQLLYKRFMEYLKGSSHK